jgi:tripartite-type tricarboxylate transporter receptor subunit TctC
VMDGIDLVAVNYRGEGAALPDLTSGRLDVAFVPVATAIGYLRSGTLHPLGVTAAMRGDLLPDVPTIGEFLSGYEASGWVGVGAPANTPAEIITILNTEANAALGNPTSKHGLSI